MKGATHVHGHTLDLIITRNSSHILSSVPTIQDPVFCDNNSNAGGDHFAVSVQLLVHISKPLKERKTITFRKLRKIHISKFRNGLTSLHKLHDLNRSLGVLVKCYDHELRTLLNQHAPEKSKTVTRHSNTTWYNDELRMAKRDHDNEVLKNYRPVSNLSFLS